MTVHDRLIDDWLKRLERELAVARAALAPRREIEVLQHVAAMLHGFRGAVGVADLRVRG
ncbi:MULTISPECIES: hypothetical protein [unclassified Nocardioides]|uniref:hypothetical protein n=1 Tax=unclassified Nocardioides TaxID=2615069 RepID=UPI000AE06E04|nr:MULTISPECIES: hypothetical protein [unclassified Nocardioides]